MLNIFGRRKPPIEVAAMPLPTVAQTGKAYLGPIVETVEETWEAPDVDQYDSAFQGYLEELQHPLDAKEAALAEKIALFRVKAEQMIEIAPDLFDKALRGGPFETGYLTDKDEDDVE